MGNLLNSLVTVAESMRTTQLAIEVAGNNVSNAKTPNFAKQRLDLIAKRFEVDRGLPGGVEAGKLVSSRKEFLEKGVQQQNQRYGFLAQQTSNLERIEPIFDVTANGGIAGSIDRLFQSFSALSVSPNDTPTRQGVLDSARNLARNFQFTTATIATARVDAQNDLRSTVDKINQLGQQIQSYNEQVRGDTRHLEDPGLDAQVFRQLEALSELVDYDLVRSPDGSFTVNLGGQTPLTIGGSFFPISVDFSGPTAIIRNNQGGDITGQIQQGRAGAQLDFQNSFLPGLTNDLNQLAEKIASSVNAALAGGLDANGNPPATDLFSYNASAGAAGSLTVNDLDPGELAAASATSPGGNGNALALADLARAPLVGGYSASQFYGSIAGRVGSRLANSRSDESTQSLILVQSRNLRANETEVSIDEEAANLVAFQRQYEANAELIRILNSLTETTIGLLR
jgi:flagellar hook-associated protein 1 FlgK